MDAASGGNPKDIIAAAYAANIEETLDAVKSKLPATEEYLNLIHAPEEIFNIYDFASEDIKHFVRRSREKKAIVTAAATDLDEFLLLKAHDEKPSKQKMKTQHFYSDCLLLCIAS